MTYTQMIGTTEIVSRVCVSVDVSVLKTLYSLHVFDMEIKTTEYGIFKMKYSCITNKVFQDLLPFWIFPSYTM